MTTRRSYTDEFKTDAVRLVEQEGYGLSEAARRLGVNRSCLARWRREGYGGSNSSPAAAKADEQELRRLRDEVRKLRTERDILKKAAAFFAKESN